MGDDAASQRLWFLCGEMNELVPPLLHVCMGH